jgi:hypothetical protein
MPVASTFVGFGFRSGGGEPPSGATVLKSKNLACAAVKREAEKDWTDRLPTAQQAIRVVHIRLMANQRYKPSSHTPPILG